VFEIERATNGQSAERRKAIREEFSAPLVADLQVWMRELRAELSSGNEVEGHGLHAQALERICALPSTTAVSDGPTMQRSVACVSAPDRDPPKSNYQADFSSEIRIMVGSRSAPVGTPSVTGRRSGWAGDGTTMPSRVPGSLVSIAHFSESAQRTGRGRDKFARMGSLN
jgi:hypothetical protein